MDREGNFACFLSQCLSFYSTPLNLAGDLNQPVRIPRAPLCSQSTIEECCEAWTRAPSRNRFEHTPASVFFSVRVLRSRDSFVNGKDFGRLALRLTSDRGLENPFTYTFELVARSVGG